MTNIPKYPVHKGAELRVIKAEVAGSGTDFASFAAGAWVTGLVAYLLACLHGLNVSRTAKGGTSQQWAAWLYPIFSIWIWGPLILLALILAIVARARKSRR